MVGFRPLRHEINNGYLYVVNPAQCSTDYMSLTPNTAKQSNAYEKGLSVHTVYKQVLYRRTCCFVYRADIQEASPNAWS
jgi:hypothetical protein